MPEIHDKNKLSIQAAPTTCSAGKLIRAKEFLACFRQTPNDLHLMGKFCLSSKQFKKVYEALIEKGLLTEFEYNHREMSTDKSESLATRPNPQLDRATVREGRISEIRHMQRPSEEIHKSLELCSNSSAKIDPLSRVQASSRHKQRTMRLERSNKSAFERPAFRPKCSHVTNPWSPDPCISCGVVFSKLRQTAKGQEVSIWEPDSRHR
ncbi:MAG: hypothetical protein ACLQPD_17965 [Desulfomonilaceae bacterium]